MKPDTQKLWAKQNRHEGDRWKLFRAVGGEVGAGSVLYPGSFVDIAPSFVFPSVTYIDTDRRTPTFFGDTDGVRAIIARHAGAPSDPQVNFIHADYTKDLALSSQSFDLLVSLYAGFVSEHCTGYLKVGGVLLVNSSHGDVAMASIDPRYRLRGVIETRSGDYRIRTENLGGYLVQKEPIDITETMLHERGRGVGYTRSPFAYLFDRVR